MSFTPMVRVGRISLDSSARSQGTHRCVRGSFRSFMVDGRETSQTKVLAGVKPSRAVTPMAPWHSGTWGGMLLP